MITSIIVLGTIILIVSIFIYGALISFTPKSYKKSNKEIDRDYETVIIKEIYKVYKEASLPAGAFNDSNKYLMFLCEELNEVTKKRIAEYKTTFSSIDAHEYKSRFANNYKKIKLMSDYLLSLRRNNQATLYNALSKFLMTLENSVLYKYILKE